MNKHLRQQVINAYLSRKDGFDWSGLMRYAQAILSSRDEIEENITPPEFDVGKAKQAQKEGRTYLEVANIRIDPKEFRANCAKMLDAYIRNGVLHDPEQVESMKGIKWDDLTDRTISMAVVDPDEFFSLALLDLSKEKSDRAFKVVLAGLLISIVRSYLNSIGQAMTELLSHTDEVASSNKSLACPVCGTAATISAVKENAETRMGTKELFCACCGTAWPFERVRCGFCGQTNPDKLGYLCADEDRSHSLYVCTECGGVLPTVFQSALKAPLDYDVEMVASGLVQTLYKRTILGKDEAQ